MGGLRGDQYFSTGSKWGPGFFNEVKGEGTGFFVGVLGAIIPLLLIKKFSTPSAGQHVNLTPDMYQWYLSVEVVLLYYKLHGIWVFFIYVKGWGSLYPERDNQNYYHFVRRGDQNFSIVRKGGLVFLLRSKGGPKKIGDGSSQIDIAPLIKKGSDSR